MRISEKAVKYSVVTAYVFGILLEFAAVIALECGTISSFSFVFMSVGGAVLTGGALLCARFAAEYFWRLEDEEESKQFSRIVESMKKLSEESARTGSGMQKATQSMTCFSLAVRHSTNERESDEERGA